MINNYLFVKYINEVLDKELENDNIKLRDIEEFKKNPCYRIMISVLLKMLKEANESYYASKSYDEFLENKSRLRTICQMLEIKRLDFLYDMCYEDIAKNAEVNIYEQIEKEIYE